MVIFLAISYGLYCMVVFKSWISYKSIMFGYNSSDWTYGWMAAFDGFTIFYSEPHEETIVMVHIMLYLELMNHKL